MQTRSSDKNSVRLSVTRVHCDKTIERSVQIYIPYERTFIPLFWEEEWLVGGDPFCVKFWFNRPPLERNRRIQPIIARSSSAVTPSEKSSVYANRKSTTRFPMSLRWSAYVAPKSRRTLPLSPPEGASKTQNGWFSLKNALRLKKVCYKVSLCENCQHQSCKAFIGLTNRAKIIGGVWPLVPEILDQSDCVGVKSPIFHIFSLVAPQP